MKISNNLLVAKNKLKEALSKSFTDIMYDLANKIKSEKEFNYEEFCSIINYGDNSFALKVRKAKVGKRIKDNLISIVLVENRQDNKRNIILYEYIMTIEDVLYKLTPKMQIMYLEVFTILSMEYGYITTDLVGVEELDQTLLEYFSDLILGEKAEKTKGLYGQNAVKLTQNTYMLLYVNKANNWVLSVRKFQIKQWCKNWVELKSYVLDDMRNLETYIENGLYYARVNKK